MATKELSRRAFGKLALLGLGCLALYGFRWGELGKDTDPPAPREQTPEAPSMAELTDRAMDIVSLLEAYREQIPQYSPNHKNHPIPEFVLSRLATSHIHPELSKDEKFLQTLAYLDHNYDHWREEPYQCYGIASLMSALFFEKTGKVLGGGDAAEKAVKDIVLPPDFAKGHAGWYSTPTGFLALKLGGVPPYPVYTLWDMRPGDFFVEYKQDSIGHIGFVLGIGVHNNTLYFDVIDANYVRQRDEHGKQVSVRDGHIRRKRLTPEAFESEYTDGTGVAGSIALLTTNRR